MKEYQGPMCAALVYLQPNINEPLAWNNGIGPRSYFVGFQDRSRDSWGHSYLIVTSSKM